MAIIACKPSSHVALRLESARTEEGSVSADPDTSPPSPTPAGANVGAGRVNTYPLGRWRLGTFVDLRYVSLELSHLLIRHRDSMLEPVALNQMDWRIPQERAERSRAGALRLARHLAERAREAPTEFAALAARFSEDPATAADGGNLGAVMASQLAAWPQLLDAIEATPAGAVTDVVETPFGFHIFHRRPPPPEGLLTGAHIVIGHTDAPLLAVAARSGPPRRSRAEAYELAQRVYRLALRAPERFEALVAQYSEHEDAARGGDFGTWSTRERQPLSRELAAVGKLAIGEITPPVDTEFGFQIIRRVADRPRREYGMAIVQKWFDPDRPSGAPESKDATIAEMTEIARQVAQDPSRFDALRRELCCSDTLRVIEGRDHPAVEAELAQLAVGQISRAPITTYSQCMLIRRIPLDDLQPTRPTVFELPTQTQVDFDHFARTYVPAFLAAQLRAVGERAPEILPATRADIAAELVRLLNRPDRFERDSPEACASAWHEVDSEVRRLLDAAEYERYRALLVRQVETAVMLNSW